MTTRIDAVGAASPNQSTHASAAARPGAPFSRVFEQAVREIDRDVAIPASEPIDARGALELQAAVYRHAERIEIVSRIVDHGVGAVKTILQTRV